jgi:hypothetical protein
MKLTGEYTMVKVYTKLFLYLIKNHAMKTEKEVEG